MKSSNELKAAPAESEGNSTEGIFRDPSAGLLSWSSSDFIHAPSSRILNFVISACCAFTLFALIASFFLQLNVTLNAPGEIISENGLREVIVPLAGRVDTLYKIPGDLVKKDEVLATLSLDRTSQNELARIKNQLQLAQSALQHLALKPAPGNGNEDQEQIVLLTPIDIPLDHFSDPNLIGAFVAVQKDLTGLNGRIAMFLSGTSQQVRPLEFRLRITQNNLARLLKSKNKSLLELQIQNLSDESLRIRGQIHALREQRDLGMNQSIETLQASLQLAISQLDRFLESHNVRSPVEGKLAKVSSHENSSVEKNQVLATIIPVDSKMIAQIRVDSSGLGHLKTGQKVFIKMDAYPYLTYGVFEGNVLSIEPLRTQDDRNDYYVIKSDIRNPSAGGRRPANTEIHLYLGMQFEANIVNERKSLIRIFFDRLTGN